MAPSRTTSESVSWAPSWMTSSPSISVSEMVVLPPLVLPQPAGVASIGLAMPNVQALAGLSLYAQAQVVSVSPISLGLTNATADVILR